MVILMKTKAGPLGSKNSLILNYKDVITIEYIGGSKLINSIMVSLIPKVLGLLFIITPKRTTFFESKLKIKRRVFRTILTIRSCR